MFRRRSSGVLLPVSALPSPYGIGDFGPQARRFVDFLRQARQSYWQILPLNHTTAGAGHSPYSCLSAFAGNPWLISPEGLLAEGLLEKADLAARPTFSPDSVDFTRVVSFKRRLLTRAFARFSSRTPTEAYHTFVQEHAAWLDDFCLFAALRQRFGQRPWYEWPREVRDRDHAAMKAVSRELQSQLAYQRFLQYTVWQQFAHLRAYCHANGIHIIGDLPLYLAYDSADVWAHPELFKLNADGRLKFKSGVPPDYFSRTGQLWGNPVYDWDRMAQDGYAWFIDRIAHNLRLFDVLRIDHFRGLVAYWEVPASHTTAANGHWTAGPAEGFFETLFARLPFARIFAEDLGQITADVRELMRRFDFAGMRVLHFGFDGRPARNCHSPHNHAVNAIAYTGTHDNNTSRGWFDYDATPAQKKRLEAYLGCKLSSRSVAWHMIRLALRSVAKVAVVPMQDLLNLGREARMNHPGKRKGNWRWRMRPGAATLKLAQRLADLTELTGRD